MELVGFQQTSSQCLSTATTEPVARCAEQEQCEKTQAAFLFAVVPFRQRWYRAWLNLIYSQRFYEYNPRGNVYYTTCVADSNNKLPPFLFCEATALEGWGLLESRGSRFHHYSDLIGCKAAHSSVHLGSPTIFMCPTHYIDFFSGQFCFFICPFPCCCYWSWKITEN